MKPIVQLHGAPSQIGPVTPQGWSCTVKPRTTNELIALYPIRIENEGIWLIDEAIAFNLEICVLRLAGDAGQRPGIA